MLFSMDGDAKGVSRCCVIIDLKYVFNNLSFESPLATSILQNSECDSRSCKLCFLVKSSVLIGKLFGSVDRKPFILEGLKLTKMSDYSD